jgi:membrane-bound lytic murein transglycosylase B
MKFYLFLLTLFFPTLFFASDTNFLDKKNVLSFIEEEANASTFTKKELERFFQKSTFLPNVLEVYNTPFKTYKSDASWTRYTTKVLTKKRIKETKRFIQEYLPTLVKAENIYQVPKEYIASFISIESHFGDNTGDYNIFSALATLAFYPNRKQEFFKNELSELLQLSNHKTIDPTTLKGSFAGALGCVQQLPSVHKRYDIDFNGDGKKDLWDIEDCIGTIANFMRKNGWDNHAPVTIKTNFSHGQYRGFSTGYNKLYTVAFLKEFGIRPIKSLPSSQVVSLLQLRGTSHDELWLGAKNFRILTTYNNSTNYGMAIFLLASMLTDHN